MATRHVVDIQVQSFFRHAPLEVDRKEPIVAPADHVDRNLWPRIETAGLAENDFRLGALMSLSFLDDLGRNVVQEIRGIVKLRAVAAPLRRRLPLGDGPVLSHHSPAVSPETGIMALTNTSMPTSTRSHTIAAVNAPSD